MPKPSYSPGEEVRIVSARHRTGAIVGQPDRRQGQYWYPVFFGSGQTETHPEEDLEPFVGAGDVRSLMRDGRFAGRESLSRLVTQLKLSLDLGSQVYACRRRERISIRTSSSRWSSSSSPETTGS